MFLGHMLGAINQEEIFLSLFNEGSPWKNCETCAFQNNPIHALGQSISFGRFMSESLAWEKWSSFSHNRYVEEAERYSRPGSVAQKKAFFEAHYKKLAAQKAAALLEQANNEAQKNATGQEDEGVIDNDNDTHNSQISPNSEMVVKEEQDAKVLSVTSEQDAVVRLTVSEHDVSVTPESAKVEGAEAVMEKVAVVGSSMKVELQNQVEDVDAQMEESEKLSAIVTPPILTPIVKVIMFIYFQNFFFFFCVWIFWGDNTD